MKRIILILTASAVLVLGAVILQNRFLLGLPFLNRGMSQAKAEKFLMGDYRAGFPFAGLVGTKRQQLYCEARIFAFTLGECRVDLEANKVDRVEWRRL